MPALLTSANVDYAAMWVVGGVTIVASVVRICSHGYHRIVNKNWGAFALNEIVEGFILSALQFATLVPIAAVLYNVALVLHDQSMHGPQASLTMANAVAGSNYYVFCLFATALYFNLAWALRSCKTWFAQQAVKV